MHPAGSENLCFACGVCPLRFPSQREVLEHRASHDFHPDFKLQESAHRRQCQILRAFYPPGMTEQISSLEYAADQMKKLARQLSVDMPYFKISFSLNVQMYKLDSEGAITQMHTFTFRTNTFTVYRGQCPIDEVHKATGDLDRNLDEFTWRGSGRH